MAINVEIKARVGDMANLQKLVSRWASEPGCCFCQEDFFFNCPKGRLKLRCFPEGRGELIHYHRENRPGPKTSSYTICPTPEPARLAALLSDAYGTLGVVRKKRWLFKIGQTRIHLDEVEELGSFVELEVVLAQDQDASHGEAVARSLMSKLGINTTDLVSQAYIDLLLNGKTE